MSNIESNVKKPLATHLCTIRIEVAYNNTQTNPREIAQLLNRLLEDAQMREGWDKETFAIGRPSYRELDIEEGGDL